MTIHTSTVIYPNLNRVEGELTKQPTSNVNIYVSLAREFQKHLSDPTWAHVLLDNGKDIKRAIKCQTLPPITKCPPINEFIFSSVYL